MRSLSLLLLDAAVASCTAQPPGPAPAPRNQAQFQALVAGKVAQPPQSCMDYRRNTDFVVLDETTVAYRESLNRVFVAHLSPGCSSLGGAGPYALVTTQTVPSLCHGDIARVVDTMAHITVGSCTFDSFVPYVRQGG